MRTSPTPLVARPAWYDRNPATKSEHYLGASVAPHAATKRLEYTCPTGKKAVVELLQCKVIRAAAATASQMPMAYWVHYKSPTAYAYVLFAGIRGNNVDDRDKAEVGQSIVLLAGEKLQGYTQDQSTGGSCDYFLAYKVTEFDA